MESSNSSGLNVETTTVPCSKSGNNEVANSSDMWISGENVNDFTEAVKNESKCKGRYCQKDWLEKNPWLMYHQDKRALFCDYCTRFADIFRFDSHDNVGLRNWKKYCERIK